MPRQASASKVKTAESRTRYYIRQVLERRGWNTAHTSAAGDVLEENEVLASFPDSGLGLDKPDFVLCINGDPKAVIEAKNESGKSQEAIQQAIGYAERMNATGRFQVSLAIGASGTEERGFIVIVRFKDSKTGDWHPLTSNGYELTNIPSKREVESAYLSGDTTTQITLPSQAEFIDAAIEVSRILRAAKVEAPQRPKVIGALVLVLYESADVSVNSNENTGLENLMTLRQINRLVKDAVEDSQDLPERRQRDLVEALHLSSAAFEQLEPSLGRIIAILRRLNIRAVMHSEVDFLGTFYEAFLRYGYDNNSLGIVFTPRHITRFCVDLVGASYADKIIDIACGTGGFLVSAFDTMIKDAPSLKAKEMVRANIFGYDTNPTVWALALLNMYFRGDGKSNIERESSLTSSARHQIAGIFDRSFLNPPFSQDEERERHFIDAATDALRPGGMVCVVVKSGVFADQEHSAWRSEFLRKHSLQAVISLPDDLFYPTAAPTCILVAKAHIPQKRTDLVYLARIENDGYEKLKGRRIERPGSELDQIAAGYHKVQRGKKVATAHSVTIVASHLIDGDEWTPHEWLPQEHLSADQVEADMQAVVGSVFKTLATFPDLLETTANTIIDGPPLPYGTGRATLSDIFEVSNGKSTGEKNQIEGNVAYVSSGDLTNSVVALVSPVNGEIFSAGQITVTAFGQASVQPWPFMARGNGGSSVRVLKPKYAMSFPELVWFAAQINSQRWRFFYARMAIKSRIVRLEVELPQQPLSKPNSSVTASAIQFLFTLHQQQKQILGR